MAKYVYVNLSTDKETLKKFNEMKDLLNTNKSKLFRDMINYFYKYKKFLKKSGISLDLEEIKKLME